MRFLHLIPRLDHNGASGQLELLAGTMLREGQSDRGVPVRSSASAYSERCGKTGSPCIRCHRRAGSIPGFPVRHARVAPELSARSYPRLASEHPAHAGRGRSQVPGPCRGESAVRLGACPTHPGLDRWLLNKAACVVVQGEAEAHLGRNQGLFLEKLVAIPPGIDETACGFALAATQAMAEPQAARRIVCVGPLERHKGFRDAIWAFDMLRFLFPDLRLDLVGDGPDRPELERMVENLEVQDVTHFVGTQADVAQCLARLTCAGYPV